MMDVTVIQQTWFKACAADEVPENGGVCVKYKTHQIALFYFTHRMQWFATQNMCPHRQQMAISRGLLGSQEGEPKVACPFHKTTFSLVDGRCLNREEEHLTVYPVTVIDGMVYIDISSLDNQTIHSDNSSAYEKASC